MLITRSPVRISFGGGGIDLPACNERMAREVGADRHELLVRESDLQEFPPRMVRHQDEPLADPVCVPVYYVSKLARDNGVTVCQVGEGSDELLWGCPYWKGSLQLQHWSNRFPRGLHIAWEIRDGMVVAAEEHLAVLHSTERRKQRRAFRHQLPQIETD
jgi:asparagine synthetase B (glutamine-hydrolysing)